MIGTLLKELTRALRHYVVFHAKRAFGAHSGPSGEMSAAAPIFEPKAFFDWRILSETTGVIYSGGPPLSTLDLLVEEPKFILDVGCSSGDFAANVKQRFPQSRVWGVEPNAGAARIAAPRIDRVLCQMIEKVDWQREGVRRGDIDTVFLFDVLEHTYDPWRTMLTLRNLISERAQLVVSLPNVRNILLIQDLISGYWRYRRTGLLDITHIRFFTYNDMCRMFYQTGFRVVRTASTHCEQSAAILQKHKDGKFPQTIELESASITVHSTEDLTNLCTVQHLFTLQPANYDRLTPGERQWIDAPHPPTMAFTAD
jgi:2-polyprenyl-3-methyl-5-hydroxy-6-metoxy-1,4-benzoquinol methylase